MVLFASFEKKFAHDFFVQIILIMAQNFYQIVVKIFAL